MDNKLQLAIKKSKVAQQIINIENNIEDIMKADNDIKIYRCAQILNGGSILGYSETTFAKRIVDSTMSLLFDIKSTLEKEFDS